VEFVGHPLVDRFAALERGEAEGSELLLLPGSRVRELRKHLPPMLEAARRIGGAIRMVLPNEALRRVAEEQGSLAGIEVQIGGLAEALAKAKVAIASSGTVTMECAYFGVPTVVIYRTSWSTYFLGRRFVRVKYLAMPNLLADREVYPELIQDEASGERIFRAASDLLGSEARRLEIKAQLREVIRSLGETGASGRAARAILKL
jgi:lipid-A-disaccharide synthase